MRTNEVLPLFFLSAPPSLGSLKCQGVISNGCHALSMGVAKKVNEFSTVRHDSPYSGHSEEALRSPAACWWGHSRGGECRCPLKGQISMCKARVRGWSKAGWEISVVRSPLKISWLPLFVSILWMNNNLKALEYIPLDITQITIYLQLCQIICERNL